MSSFFDKPFFQQLIVGLILLLLSLWLGTRTAGPATGGKAWKIVIIVSWIMTLGGLYLLLLNLSNGGLKNEEAATGFGILFFGIVLNWIGKFFLWWHR